MPQSLAKVYLHVVFSTKHREPFLADRALRRETHAYLAGACRTSALGFYRFGLDNPRVARRDVRNPGWRGASRQLTLG